MCAPPSRTQVFTDTSCNHTVLPLTAPWILSNLNFQNFHLTCVKKLALQQENFLLTDARFGDQLSLVSIRNTVVFLLFGFYQESSLQNSNNLHLSSSQRLLSSSTETQSVSRSGSIIVTDELWVVLIRKIIGGSHPDPLCFIKYNLK